jgi:Fur family transcriptional regulator, ferric uptake regulator
MTSPHAAPPVEAGDVDEAIALLRAGGLRASAARRLVLETLFDAEEPVAADAIAAASALDLPTVYRNLETLEQLGIVRHFHLGHGPGLYVRSGAAMREFLVCDRCGATKSLPPSDLDRVREAVRAETGWEARFTHFPMGGLCPGCREGG